MKTQKNKKALSLKEGYIQYAYRHVCINDDKHVKNMAIVQYIKSSQVKLVACSYVFLCCVSYTYGQGNFSKITPQSADFVRNGLIPVSCFSGKASVEIPLYTLQDLDFSMLLSLSYTSDGLKPAKRSGLVGLDWVLNFGGVITREVYGSPDDANGYYGIDPARNIEYAIVKGFWNTQKLTSSRTTYRMHGNLPVKDSIMQSFKNEPYQFMTAYPYYDSFGHALFEINRDGTRTIRLWGYNCRYLVAEMYNIPETDMNAAWNIIRPESFSFSSSPDFSFVSVLRRSYPDIQVYLYTYSPLVGVRSVTSPNGKVTNFRYDTAGRLVERTDHAGHVESRYEYNYMPY